MGCQALPQVRTVAWRNVSGAQRVRANPLRHRRCTVVIPRAAVVGIDLGTSNSAVAALENGVPRVLKNDKDQAAVPSLVAIAEDGTMLVGQAVLDPPQGYITPYSRSQPGEGQATAVRVLPSDCFHSFKRLLGRKADEVAEDAARLGYIVGEGDQGEAAVYSPALDDMLSPDELSTWLLQHLKQMAEQQLEEAVTGAVITIPAHFKQTQQGATHAAAQRAGISQVQLLQEPVAAALAYGIHGGTDGDTVLVFDVGGGTFDVSILQAFEGIMEVLGTAGDFNLGGNNFDARLADWLLAECASRSGATAANSAGGASGGIRGGSSSSRSTSSGGISIAGGAGAPDAQQRAWAMSAAEAAKVALASAEHAEVALPGGGAPVVLTQQRFEELSSDLFQLMANVLEALGDALFIEWAVKPSDAVPGRCSGSNSRSSVDGHNANLNGSSSSSGSEGGESSSTDAQRPRDKWAPPPRRITQVALVGQVTCLPSVQQFVQRITGVQPRMSVDPAEAVALGAAIHAGVLLGEVSGVELMDGSYSQGLHDRATGFSGWQP